MSWKIKKISIENFKYFHTPFSLDVNSRNLLIYGENGSGKSSIYWALYTLFQSRLKPTDADVEKYFDATNGENLRNKYSAAGDISKVEVIFEDKDNPAALDKVYTIAQDGITTRQMPDAFLDFTIASSDFLNYKMLSKLTDKDNSVLNDVTELFVKEIYPFADFQIEYTDLNGNLSGTRNARKWHDYIYSSISQLEHQKGRRRSHFDKTGTKYGHYTRLIRDFRDQLAIYLADLSLRATTKLHDDFDVKDIEVLFETDPSYDFDLQSPTSPRIRDHKLHPLHIRLNAKLKNAQLVGGETDIVHLRTFFNEAKLTCIGLAVRLAVADMKYLAGSNLASVLCLDDLLVSLDMSYRVPVIEALFRYAINYQLCVFTHDRILYNMMRNVVKELGYVDTDWQYLEFYHADPAKEALEEPKVVWIEEKGIKDKVKNYLLKGDYPAAGNSLRKYAEELLKSILPLNLTYGINSKGEVKNLMLGDLYKKSQATGRDGFCSLYDISPSIMPNIAKHVERLMNPLSHDDKEVPLYRRELENAFIEVEKYEPIRDAKTVLVDQKDAGVRKFKMMITDGVTTIEVEFVTTEQWDYIVFPAPTGKKYKDCEVMIVSCLGWTYPINSKIRVKFLYNDIRNRIFHGAAGAPAFDQTITDVASGLLLCAL